LQTAHGEDDKCSYEFTYMEVRNKILIWKDKDLQYTVSVSKTKEGVMLTCNCPGHTHHGHCKHTGFCENEFNFNHIVKPRSDINKWREEYINEYLDRLEAK